MDSPIILKNHLRQHNLYFPGRKGNETGVIQNRLYQLFEAFFNNLMGMKSDDVC